MKKSNFLRRFQLFRHQTESWMCSLAILHPWFPPSKAPLKIRRSWVQFLLMTEWKNPIFFEDFNFFDIRPRAKCVLFALLHPWFTLSKAPLKIRRSWVQFLLMTEWKNPIFSEDFNFFDISLRAKCVLLLFYILDFPRRKHPRQFGGHEFNSYSWQNEKIQFSQKISTFSTSDRELNVFSCSFTSLISPFESTLKIGRSWVQFLLMTEWKNQIFSEDFNFFLIWPRAKCVLFALLHPWFTLSKAPLKIRRSWFQFLRMTESKNQISSEDFNFFDIWPRAKCVLLALLHPWYPPSKAPVKIGRSWVQFLLMTEWKKSNFSRRFQLFPHLTESKISWCFPSSPSPPDPCRRECHGLNSYDQPKKPLSRYFFQL